MIRGTVAPADGIELNNFDLVKFYDLYNSPYTTIRYLNDSYNPTLIKYLYANNVPVYTVDKQTGAKSLNESFIDKKIAESFTPSDYLPILVREIAFLCNI